MPLRGLQTEAEVGSDGVGPDGGTEEDVEVAPDAEADARLPGKGKVHIARFFVHSAVNFTCFRIVATADDPVDAASAESQVAVEGDDVSPAEMEISACIKACENTAVITGNGDVWFK